jgi:tetratricopeptide (TPR) repeat protein
MTRQVFPARVWLLGGLLLGLLLVSRPAAAQDYAAAGQHFEAAQESFQKGDFPRAAQEYQAAYNITKDPALLFQIGEAWQRAGDAQQALASYRAYVKEQPTGADRAEADKRILSIEAVLNPPSATPQAVPPAAAVAPSPPLAADPATTPAPPATTPPPTAATPPPVAPPPVAPPPSSAPPPRRLRTAGWIAVALGVAVATSGAILGLGAQNRADELGRRTNTTVNGQPPIYDANQADAYQTLMSEGRAYNIAAISLLGVAGASLATGAALFIADWVLLPKEAKSPLARLPLPSLLIGSGSAQLAVSGSF